MSSIGTMDKSAIGLSIACVLHCLTLPIVLVMIPSLSGLWFADESFHVILIYVIVPISVVAIFLGCKRHRSVSVFAYAALGLAVLIVTVVLGHALLGELGEKALTVVGAALITASHIKNFRLCRACH
ncbi:MAG: MerC domain-containing protein [Pseudomonadales bacterium]|nr:MerC domain-containing protein [Pseudomonadales bacterium]